VAVNGRSDSKSGNLNNVFRRLRGPKAGVKQWGSRVLALDQRGAKERVAAW
jgi:hypothetical protein